MATEYSLSASNAGAEFARTTIARAQALTARYPGAAGAQQRDNAIQALRNETSAQLSHLTKGDRIDYVEYMAKLAKIDSADADDLSELAFIFITAGPSAEEMTDGNSRLLASDDPRLREMGEGLVMQGSVKLPNGEMGQDMSVFDLALHDPKVPQDRLIGALFKVAPVESAQWFADHAGLPADERAGLESDLRKAWQLHRAVNDPSADPGTKAILDDKVKKFLLDHWLNSPSWILRSLANGLLQKHQEWQTPDLKKAMQPVPVPSGLQISSS